MDTKRVNEDVKILAQSLPDISYYSRTVTYGEEYDLVQRYLNFLIKKYKQRTKTKTLIFLEPQLETGYPDIVIVEYFFPKGFSFVDAQVRFSLNELKILFHIQTKRYVIVDELLSQLGYSKEFVEATIEKLLWAKLIYKNKDGKAVRCVSLKKYFPIRKIIAIEAKMNKWGEAIKQANMNTWFSTESYILLNRSCCSPKIKDRCKSDGLGIILVNGDIHTELIAEKRKLPVSYASFQFNEWLRRYYYKELEE